MFTKALPAEKYRLLWWTDPYYPKAKVSTIVGNEIKNYRNSLRDTSGKWKLEVDDKTYSDSYDNENEFENFKGFYSPYIYKVSDNYYVENSQGKTRFDVLEYIAKCKKIMFYKLKLR